MLIVNNRIIPLIYDDQSFGYFLVKLFNQALYSNCSQNLIMHQLYQSPNQSLGLMTKLIINAITNVTGRFQVFSKTEMINSLTIIASQQKHEFDIERLQQKIMQVQRSKLQFFYAPLTKRAYGHLTLIDPMPIPKFISCEIIISLMKYTFLNVFNKAKEICMSQKHPESTALVLDLRQIAKNIKFQAH